MKKSFIYTGIFLGVSLVFCSNRHINVGQFLTKPDLDSRKISDNMKSFISIFEILVLDFARATDFYESLLDIKIGEIDIQGTQMGLFTAEGQMVSGVLVKGDDYHPSGDGVLIYLNGGDDLQLILDKVESSGG